MSCPIPEKLLVEKNDIIICARNGSRKLVGKSAIIKELHEPMTFGAFMAICKTPLYKYVSIYLQTPLFFSQLREDNETTTICQLTQSRFNNFLIPIPPFPEQYKICNRMDDLSRVLNLYEETFDKLSTLNDNLRNSIKKSILQEAIQGRLVPQIESEGTAEHLLAEIREEKIRLVKEGKLKKSALAGESRIFRGDDNKYREKKDGMISLLEEEIPFEIPATWTWVRLDDICTYIQRGKSPKYSLTKKIPVVAQKCNQWSGFQIDKAQFIEPTSIDSYGEERKLVDGDLMWNSTGLGTLGRMAIYWERLNPYGIAVADSHVTVIRPIQNKILSEYLFAYFSSYTVQSVIEDKSDGSTKQKELSTSTIKNYLVPLPPYAAQQRIVAKIHKVLASIMSS